MDTFNNINNNSDVITSSIHKLGIDSDDPLQPGLQPSYPLALTPIDTDNFLGITQVLSWEKTDWYNFISSQYQPVATVNNLVPENSPVVGNTPSFIAENKPKNLEVAFIDSSVTGYEYINSQPNSHVIEIHLDSTQDGINQIADFAQQLAAWNQEISAFHIISHGDQGSLQLGNATLNNNNILGYQTTLENWGQILTPDGDILFYACDTADGEIGQQFIQQISQYTQADVAASIDETGSSIYGYNSKLEYSTGNIEANGLFFNDQFQGSLSITQTLINAANGQLSNLILGDFIRLSGTFNTTTLQGTNISGFVGVGADTVTTTDDVGLNITGANFSLSDANNDDNYEYSLTNANVSLVGFDNTNFNGTINLTGNDTSVSTTLNNLGLQLNDNVRITGNFGFTADDNTTQLTTINASLFAGIGANTSNTNDDAGLSLTGVNSTINFTDNGTAYLATGNVSLIGIDGLTLNGTISAQGNDTGSQVTIGSTSINNGVNQVTGDNLTIEIDNLITLTGDVDFEFRNTDNAILGVGSDIEAAVSLASGVNGNLNNGTFGLVWYGQDDYALQGKGTASLDVNIGGEELTFTGDLGFDVNKTGEKINETVNGKNIKFDSISEVVQFNASNLDVSLNNNSLKDAIMAGVTKIKDIQANLLPQYNEQGDEISEGSFLLEQLPGTDTSLDNLLGINSYLSLGEEIENYFDNNSSPTLQGLITYINNNWGNNLPTPVDLDFVLNSTGLDFSFAADYSLNKNINIGLPAEAAELGLVEVQGNAEIELAIDAGIDFDLGIDFANFNNSSFVLNRLGFDASASASDIVLGAYFGPLGVSLGSDDAGKQKGSATIDLGGNIAYDSNSGFTITPTTNNINVFLPVYASIAGTDLTTGTPPTITINGNPFVSNGITFNATGFSELLDFKNFSVADVLYTIQSLINWAEEFRDYDVMSTEIPLANITLGDTLDFASSINDQILEKFDFSQIRTIDQLITAINNSGVLPNGFSIAYNATTKELILPFEFQEALDSINDVPLDLSLELGDLSLSTNSKTTVNANVDGRIDLIVDFDGETGTEGLNFYVDNVALNGGVNFNVSDLEVAAQLGFLGLTAGGAGTNSGVELNAIVETELKDNQSNKTRFNINELLDGNLLDKFNLNFQGDGFAKLKGLAVNGGFGNINIAPNVELGVYLPDLTDVTGLQVVNQPVNQAFNLQTAINNNVFTADGVIVVLPDISELLSLKELSFENIIDGIQAGIDFLRDTLADNPFYNTPIPIINVSLAETFTFLDDLSSALNDAIANPASLLEEVEAIIESALGLNDNNNLPSNQQLFSLSLNGNFLDIHLGWEKLFSEIYDFNLDLETIKELSGNAGAAALDLIDSLADLNGGGNILLEAIAKLNFDIAISLDSLKNGNPEIALRDYNSSTGEGTFARLGARLEGTNLDLNFKVGPIDIGVVDGAVVLDGNGQQGKQNNDDWAGLLIAIDQQAGSKPDDGLYYILEENFSNNLDLSFTGGFNVNLPILLDVLGAQFNLDPITIGTNPVYGNQGLWELFKHLANSSDKGSFDPLVMTFPDIQGEFANLGGDFSLLSILNDPSFILDGVDLAVGSLEDILDSNLAQDIPLLGDKLATAATFLRDMRQGILADLREKLSGNGKAIQIIQQTLFDVFGTGGLNILKDSSDAGTDIDLDDVVVGWFDGNGVFLESWEVGDTLPTGVDAIQFDMDLGGTVYGAGIDLPLDFDLPGFSLDVNGGFGLDISWSFDFGFGLSLKDSFYLTAADNPSDPELQLNISAFLDGNPEDTNITTPFSATGQLLFLQADLEDNNPNNRASGVYGELSLDMIGNSRGRLTLDRLLGGRYNEIFDIDFGVEADLDLQATLSLDGSTGLPRLRGDLQLSWDWQIGSPVTAPSVDLANFSVDLGSYVSGFLQPIAQKINEVLQPLKPVIDAFTTEIPGLGVILDDPTLKGLINVLLQLKGRSPIDWSFLDEAKQMLGLVDAISGMNKDENNWLLLGDITGLGTNTPGVDTSGVTLNQSQIDALSNQLKVDNKPIRQTSYTSGTSTVPRSGFQVFPYLKDISNWMKLLTGGDATLFTYELPLLKFNADFRVLLATYGIPKVASLDINAIAGFSAFADLGFGYDTFGIRQSIKSGNPLYALDGFYVMDFDMAGNEKNEFGLSGYVGLEGSVNLAIARGGIDGRITLDVGADMQDIGKSILTKDAAGYVTNVQFVGDGKIRGSEIATMWNYQNGGLANLFNLTADLGLEANVFGDLYIPFKGWTNVFREQLFKFTFPLVDYDAPNVQPVLATQVGSTLYLNSGNRAADRLYGNIEDGGEVFTLYTDINSGNKVGVEFDGYYQTFSGVTKIVADGGLGDDTFDATRLNNVTLEITGGAGNDRLISGTGAVFFDGGEGDDVLDASGSTGNSTLKGGAGEDQLTGGSGNDNLEGGSGDDRLSAGAGNDTVDGGEGADRLNGEAGDDKYIFADNFGLDRFNDSDSSTFDFSAVTQSLNVGINRRGVNAYYLSANGSSNEVKGGSSVDKVILGTGNDAVTITDFAAGTFNLQDQGGNDTYRVTLSSGNGSTGQGIINLTDNNGAFDQVILEQTTWSNPISLNQNQVLNGREILNYNSGVDRITVIGKAAQFNGNQIIDFGSRVTLTNSDNNGVSRLGTTDLRVIANSVDFQSQINSDAIIVETLKTIQVDQTLNAVQNGYIDLRTYQDHSNIELSANLRVSSDNSNNGAGSGWIRLTAPDGSIINTNGSQILASGSHLIIKAKDSLGTITNPLLTQVGTLTAVTATHGTGDLVIRESDSLILTNLEATASVENGGLTIPSGLAVVPTWVEENQWITTLNNSWRNAITDGNESQAIAVGNGNIHLTLTGNNALLTLASGSLSNLKPGGDINIITDDLNFQSGANQIQGTGNLTIHDYSTSLLYRLGSAAVDNGVNNALDISNQDLAALQDGFNSITIGRSGVNNTMQIGDIYQNGGVQPELRDSTTLLGNNIQVIGDARGVGVTLDILADNNISFTSTGKITTNATITMLADADGNGTGGIQMADGSVVNAVNSYIDVDATENITLGLLTTTGAVTVDSSQGAILDADTNGNLDIIANTAILQANQGIGTASNALETQLNYLEADGGNGGIWNDNQGNLIIGEISTLEGLRADDDINVTTTGALQVKEDVTSRDENNQGANVTLQSIDSSAAGENLTVIGGVEIDGENVTLQGGDNLHLQVDSVVNADQQITIQGDHGNQDLGTGTRIDLDGRILAETVLIQGETDADIIDIHVQELAGNSLVQGNNSDDLIIVDQLPSLDINQRGSNNRDTLTLDGQADDDDYIINITGDNTDYWINVFDTGSNDNDELTVYGTQDADEFLLRASEAEFADGGVAFVAALHGETNGNPNTLVERINYNRNLESLIIESQQGDDNFTLDDNWTVTTIRGGEGADSFQVGQMFKAERDAQAGIAAEDLFSTTATTRGYLSNGVTSFTTIAGGDGDDQFTVFRNLAALDLQGDNGDDLFVIRAFAKEGSFTSDVDSGEGVDTVEYVINAPVNINGGAGTDTLRVIGTEFADKFIITKDAIFGAGRTITYTGVEIVEIDGAEGKDEFYVLSTYADVVTSLFGGLGSDYFSLGGDTAMVQAGIPTADDIQSFSFIEPDGTINPQIGSHTVNQIQGKLIIDGYGGEGSTGGLGEPVMLPNETNLLESTGEVISFSGTGAGSKTDTMTVLTAELQAALTVLSLTVLNDLVGKTLEISRGNGLRRFWQITGLSVNAQTGYTTLTLLNPGQPAKEWTLPDGDSEYAITSLSSNFFVNEDTVQDQVTVFEDGEVNNDTGLLTENQLTGLGLGADGVTYQNLEIVEVLLGQGDDNFTVNNTADGAITSIHGGGGSDHITALDRGGANVRGENGEIVLEASLVMFGDTTQDGSRYSSTPNVPAPGFANRFTNPGNDRIDASAMVEMVSIYGGNGNDSIQGSQAGDHLTGGAGNDTIQGLGGNDHIYGDSGLNVNLSTRELTVPTTDLAGLDNIDGGAGEDIIFGDHGVIAQTLGTQRILTTGNVESMTTNEFANGAADRIEGGLDSDRILGGAGADEITDIAGNNIIFGDHGLIDYNQGDNNLTTVDAIQTTVTNHGDVDTITTGADHDMILGGTAGDVINANHGNNLVIGDFAEIILSDGKLETITSTNTNLGGDDVISTGVNHDVIIAGNGDDDVNAGDGDNIVIGDSGKITLSAGKVNRIETIDSNLGGNDIITTGNGEDIVLGGFANDNITTNAGNDIVLGDNGYVSYTESDNDPSDIDRIKTTNIKDGGNDTINSGAGNDIVLGGVGNDRINAGDNNDLIFGDNGVIEGDVKANLLPLAMVNQPFTFTSIETANTDGSGNALGGQDIIYGGAGDDIAIAGQGNDTVYGEAGDDDIIGGHNVAGGHDGNDILDGGTGNDAIAGDNASILRRADTLSPRMRVLSGTVIYDSNGNPQVTNAGQLNPTGAAERNIILLDHSVNTSVNNYGNDVIAGGADDDLIFGQLGNDSIQGDSSTAETVSTTDFSVTAITDGDDYIEGGGGDDLIFGNLGQDDIIGGSSSLFGNSTASQRPDGKDVIFGGAGTSISSNNLGDTSNNGHAQDADVIVGDNGNIFRLVGTNGVSQGKFLTFTYDNYGTLKIIPRAVQELDYIAGNNIGDLGNDDVIFGEAGDDVIYGMTGNDVIFGDGQDDDIYGGDGSDRLYGGTGVDGILGDNGKIYTSRNGLTETLNGITTANVETNISLPGPFTGARLYITGQLHKTVDIAAWDQGGNDVIYGGLGDDFLHGGAGDDAISGAEAQATVYNSNPVTNTNPLNYDPVTRKFAAYDANNPMKRIDGFFLNFDAVDSNGKKINDGQDHIFGDVGHDWLVGGTENDRLFGGMGDDLMNADDNLDTNGGLNNRPDDPEFADGDFAFGGDGLDVLIANTGNDRLFDWLGEFNSFWVPFSPFGNPTIVRSPSPLIQQFILDLGKGSGADQTRTEADGELGLITPQDQQWQDQHGSPRDPQPGNTQTQRDTQGSPEYNRNAVLPMPDSTISEGKGKAKGKSK